ncbi:MAG: exopolyphosphatase [Desulfuromonadales bacterium]|nr:exopolyphosphatase [Desulfuromonadales bacterium]
MQATVDIGSNTVRMLVGSCDAGRLQPRLYERRITRLGGGFSVEMGLSATAMARTLAALKEFSTILEQHQAQCLRAVGTAALRRAVNRQQFIEQVFQHTGLSIDVIDGVEEAQLAAIGVLSAISPHPGNAVIFDIGGGSTELIIVIDGRVCVQQSYPFGVVRLAEEYDPHQQEQTIAAMLTDFRSLFQHQLSSSQPIELIGTAGTMTTLAAIDLGMIHYDPTAINNHRLSLAWMHTLYDQLVTLSAIDREQLAGMEQGRGDLILPGLRTATVIAEALGVTHLKVADAGLLEGVFLAACRD